jgi:predicted nucleotide-binding protein
LAAPSEEVDRSSTEEVGGSPADVTVDPKLHDRLQAKLDVGERRVNQLIEERARTLLLSREEAAVALAYEVKVSVPPKLASPEVLAAIRQATAAKAPTPEEVSTQRVTPAPSAASRSQIKTGAARKVRRKRAKNPRKVAVVHGRDTALRTSMFRFLRAIGLSPIEWSEAVKATKKASPYIGEVLDKAFEEAAAVVVLLTPDDVARFRPEFRKASDPEHEATLTGQARPNVLFEAGMAFGRHPDSTILVEIGELRPFSDVGGRHVVRLNDHGGVTTRPCESTRGHRLRRQLGRL